MAVCIYKYIVWFTDTLLCFSSLYMNCHRGKYIGCRWWHNLSDVWEQITHMQINGLRTVHILSHKERGFFLNVRMSYCTTHLHGILYYTFTQHTVLHIYTAYCTTHLHGILYYTFTWHTVLHIYTAYCTTHLHGILYYTFTNLANCYFWCEQHLVN